MAISSPPQRSVGSLTRNVQKSLSKSPCNDVAISSHKMTLIQSPPPSNQKAFEESGLESITSMQKECLALMKFKQYKSSEALARFELSTLLIDFQKLYNSSSESFVDRQRTISISQLASSLMMTLEIIADCCFFTNEHKRALHYYRQAIHYSRIAFTY